MDTMAGLQSEGLHFCIMVYPLGSLWFLPFSKRPSCSQLRWNGTLKDGFFRTELCGKPLPSLYRASRPNISISLLRSHVTIVND